MNLFEINFEIEKLLNDAVDEETGEINEEALKKLDEVGEARETKIDNICFYIKNLKAEREAVKKYEKDFADKGKALDRKIDRIKSYLEQGLNGEKFKSIANNIYYNHSTSVEVDVDNLDNFDEKYLRRTVELNKTALKEALDNGEAFEGIRLVEKKSMVIR